MRHITLLSRTGRLPRGAPPAALAGLLDASGPGWTAAVTLERCDAAVAEEVLSTLASRTGGVILTTLSFSGMGPLSSRSQCRHHRIPFFHGLQAQFSSQGFWYGRNGGTLVL